jgi:hypothetical protein
MKNAVIECMKWLTLFKRCGTLACSMAADVASSSVSSTEATVTGPPPTR